VFEATVMGTRSIVSDPNVAGELPEGSYWQPRDGSIAALAETLSEVSTAVRTGALRPMPGNTGDALRQSAQTERMIAVYERVLRPS